jgi:ATP-binding cassette subfamily B protein
LVQLVFAFLARYARPYLRFYLLGGAMLVATAYATVRIPTLIGEALNAIAEAGPASLLDAENLALELMFWGLALVGVRTLSRILFFNPGRDAQFHLMVDLFGHLMTLPRPFYVRHKVGELVSVASNDMQSVRLLVGFAALQVCNVAVQIPMHVGQMVILDSTLAMWCIVPVLLGGIHMVYTVRRFYTRVRLSLECLAQLSDRILESYAGVRTFRSHAVETSAVERFTERNAQYRDLMLEIAGIRAFAMPVLGFVGRASVVVVLWIGAERVIDGALGVGDLVAFVTLLASLAAILTSLAWVLTAISRGTVSLRRVQDLFDESSDAPADSELETLDSSREAPGLSLRGLDFRYPGDDRLALSGLEAEVPAGATLGIFGETGSGKTTLIELLSRVYEPGPGQVFIDGKDVTTLSLSSYRRALTVVPQDPFLFSATLRENIRMRDDLSVGEESAGTQDPRLDAAIEAACLGPDMAQLGEGLDTVVGERGVMLSGGQRQRTALARALYRRPRLLLLDDVLSAVDQETESRLVQAIRALRDSAGGRSTTVIVSHRTSVLEHCDEILVLDAGVVAERGTHRELLAADGLYALAHRHQEDAEGPVPSSSPEVHA